MSSVWVKKDELIRIIGISIPTFYKYLPEVKQLSNYAEYIKVKSIRKIYFNCEKWENYIVSRETEKYVKGG
ncbi:hypothetical protein HZY83_07515 [Gemella sp. GH3]|uniref:hypothetical protein n=1 Tax=unclassified Gemella TaxID=2624949 RepID=UPI0015D0B770|nr:MULTISPECIES: hypothetical protein [unclassified Gemella]MBF0714522.1 hypothetical protein [Gemella sp. GH3.1]NYS51474.1 hypothetical protein [Gemella sp. GH3]